MIIRKYFKVSFDASSFHQELGEQWGGKVNFQHDQSKQELTVYFTDPSLTVSEMDSFQAMIDAHNPTSYKYPIILDYMIDKSVPILSVDHYKNLIITPRVTEVYGETSSDRGLLLRKNYFADDAHQIHLFYVEYQYQINFLGHLTHQSVKLVFLDQDGNSSLVKDKGFAAYSDKESRWATRRRREAVVFLLESSLIEMLSQGPQGAGNISSAAQFMEAVAPGVNAFLNSGLTDQISEYIALPGTLSEFSFLSLEIAPGYTVAQFIMDGLTYD